MAFNIPFPGKATLKETETTIEAYQLGKCSNLTGIQGRNAAFDDNSAMNVNVAEFEPVDHLALVHRRLIFVETSQVDFGAMAAAGMTQLGGDGHEFTIFVSDKPKSIFIFYRM